MKHHHHRCNVLENPIGIETDADTDKYFEEKCCNVLENPIGIETEISSNDITISVQLQRTRKPDRD